MKSAGPERDKEIAELRGWREAEIKNGNAYGIPPDFVSQSVSVPPYSTDISTAMELWDEMEGAECSISLIFTPVCDGIEVELNHGDNNTTMTSIVGDSKADAISGAWLKWKESA